MAERYLFFNSTQGDPRDYNAQNFAEYFGSVLSSGLLHTDNEPGMKVSVERGTLKTVVSAGKAIIKGHLYENTSDLKLTHDIPEPELDRIDRIVLRLNLENSERNIKLHVLKGVPSEEPVPPEVQRDDFIHELSLAQILVKADTSQLSQEDLLDERLDDEVCGIVYSLISLPTDVFHDTLESWKEHWSEWFNNLKESSYATVEELDDWIEYVDGEVTSMNERTESAVDSVTKKTNDAVETMSDTVNTAVESMDEKVDDATDLLETHMNETIADSIEGFHGLRIKDEVLEYFDGIEWKRVLSSAPTLPPGTISNTFYDHGDEWEDVTGGWIVGNRDTGSFVKESDRMEVTVRASNISGYFYITTARPVDFTDLNRLLIKKQGQRYNPRARVIISDNQYGTDTPTEGDTQYLNSHKELMTWSIDVSKVTGYKYIRIYSDFSSFSGTSISEGTNILYKIYGEN